MPIVWIPPLLRDLTGGETRVSAVGATVRDLTGGETRVSAAGATVREAIEDLERRYPGVKARLLEDDRLRPNIAVIVDGVASQKRLRERVEEGSEIHFLPAISGGSWRRKGIIPRWTFFHKLAIIDPMRHFLSGVQMAVGKTLRMTMVMRCGYQQAAPVG